MSELATLVKSEWDHFFVVANTENGWIVPLVSAIEGISCEEAFWRPGGSVASVADILLHATGWLDSTLADVLGMPQVEHEDWPEAPSASTGAWAAMEERLKQTVMELSRALHNLSLEELYSSPRGAESKRSTMLTDIFVHSAYHAGQIVKLRQAYAALETAAIASR